MEIYGTCCDEELLSGMHLAQRDLSVEAPQSLSLPGGSAKNRTNYNVHTVHSHPQIEVHHKTI